MRHRTSPQRKQIEAEVQARRQAAYDAMLANRQTSEQDAEETSAQGVDAGSIL